jgi:hypothetical protein
VFSRRTFVRRALSGAIVAPLLPRLRVGAASPEVLYNGITLGTPWPPRRRYPDDYPVTPPYLLDPPATIPIDVGRQLFVDDFLIEETSLLRTWHRPEYYANNPVLRPDTEWENRDPASERRNLRINPAAMVFSDGVFFDPKDRLFKMWYMAGYGVATCLATSTDGFRWQRPSFDVVKGTNITNAEYRDSSTVWIDPADPDPRRRYKMSIWYDGSLILYVSPDGIHWTKLGSAGKAFDRSTFFYNPFRKMWVFSLRGTDYPGGGVNSRYRLYWESKEFNAVGQLSLTQPVAWVRADALDVPRPDMTQPSELYNLDCAGYESLMIGLFSIWRGEYDTREKINDLTIGFSRDGFHWSREDRTPFVPVSETPGSWNWANIQSAGGCCLIVGDKLHFYVSGRQGVPGTNEPGACSTGLALLRRDGFASMDWRKDDRRPRPVPRGELRGGYLTTRTITFNGAHLFVNADVTGELRAEMLDEQGRVIAPFTRDACAPFRGDRTRASLSWTGGSLAQLAGRRVKLRFWVEEGRLYAFWISPRPSGESRGATAGGGPEFAGTFDTGPAGA